MHGAVIPHRQKNSRIDRRARAAQLRVSTTSGTVEGFTEGDVSRWLAIPYARPPRGALRLRAPEPAIPWRGVRHCHEFVFCAPQQRRYTIVGLNKYQSMSEDCLTLNVVAPGGAQGRLPVLVFIHGGGYLFGSSATPVYGGANLARRGCVYVSINYRVGALGCLDLSSLATPDHPIEGNLFLRDIILALRWVRDNIAGFGGDPDDVTLFGQSAGAHAVSTLLTAPSAAGLFARAIMESPASGLNHDVDEAAVFAARFAKLMDLDPANPAAGLASATPRQFVEALDRLASTCVAEFGAFAIGATIDGEILPQDPIVAMASGAAHRVPIVLGSNAEEGRVFGRVTGLLPMTEPEIERVLQGVDNSARQRIAAAYREYPESSSACMHLGGDLCFGSAAWQIAESHSRHAPTYFYRFDYAPRTLKWMGMGATHSTELLAVFDVYRTTLGSLLTLAADRGSALRVSRDIQRRWSGFWSTGVPGDGWPAYTEKDRAVLVFDRRSRVERDPMPARRQAWEGVKLRAT